MTNILFPNSFTIQPSHNLQLGQTDYHLDQVQNVLLVRHAYILFSAFAIILLVLAVIFLIAAKKTKHLLNFSITYIVLILLTDIVFSFKIDKNIDQKSVNQAGIRIEQTNFAIKPVKTNILAKIIRTGQNNKLTNYRLYAAVKPKQKPVYFATVKDRQLIFANNSTSALMKKYLTFIQTKHLENDFKNNAQLVYDINYLDQNNNPQLVLKGQKHQVLHLTDSNKQVQLN